MVEFNYDILYVHQPSLKKNTNTWVCAECVKPFELKNCKAVHIQLKDWIANVFAVNVQI